MPRLIIDLPEDQEFEKSVQNAYEAMAKQAVRNVVDKAMEKELGRVVEGRVRKCLEGYGSARLVSIVDNAMTMALHSEIGKIVEKCSTDEERIRKIAEKVYAESLSYTMRFNGESVQDYLTRRVTEIINDTFEKKLKEQLPEAVKAAFTAIK